MSYTNGTTHYNLPLTTGSDKRDWADPNQAFADVDAALYGAVQDTAQAELDIDALETRMDIAEQNISTNTGNISGLDTRLTTAEGAITSQAGQITDTRQDLEDMICAYNEASATSTHAYAIGDYFIYNDVLYKATQAIAIGDTIVPDTNCSTTNVTTEILNLDTKAEIMISESADGVKTLGEIFDTLLTTLNGSTNINDYDFTIYQHGANTDTRIFRGSAIQPSLQRYAFTNDYGRVEPSHVDFSYRMVAFNGLASDPANRISAVAVRNYMAFGSSVTPSYTITSNEDSVPTSGEIYTLVRKKHPYVN